MMEKTPVIIRYLICTSCLLLLLGGCDRSTGTPARAKVVRKKIVAPQKKAVTVRKTRTSRVARTAPATGVQQPASTAKPIAKIKTDQPAPAAKPLPAQKTQPTKMASTRTAGPAAKAQKPAPAPRSEISPLAKPAAAGKQPVANGGKSRKAGAATSRDQLLASAPGPGMTLSSDGSPPLYNPAGKIDPFEPLFREKPVTARKSKRKKRIPRTPLERIELSQLRLVGIILAPSGNRALVEESSGKGYIIKKGTYVGTNAGKVVRIKKNKIIVEEEFEDVFGKVKTRKRELKLPKPPGEL